MKKKAAFFVTVSCAVIVMSLNPFPVKAAENINPANGQTYISITPAAATIDWRYKVEDGKLYKRLYNYQKQEWVGEWILC